ncbi:SDR family NAD(P)-dependent oxidoreductase [Paenibacillus luteus]|uniref:SDR family NAD(P)-dependent oxidoreductase n=1 Tax=Paenibacillus luteus TaxID=2545753 RepID=UPI001141E028|nr:SDR family NAD(P)-dependent oxidoreductase [Paenibacillus luteus]
MTNINQTKVALVTGAASGVGLELTKRLLAEGWQVLALIRSSLTSDDPLIASSLQTKQLRMYRADLADFKALKTALNQIKSKEPYIDVIFNNAGVSLGERNYSLQGREMHFEVNTVVPYFVYLELKPLLLKGTMKTVINTSSNALLFLKQFDFKTLDSPATFKKLVGPYAASKLALSLWTQEAALSALTEGIRLRSACPGGNKTTMTKNAGMPRYMIPIRNLFFSHPSKGASRLYEAALGNAKEMTGVFLNKGKTTPLRFADQSQNVLEKVHFIYQQEFSMGSV